MNLWWAHTLDSNTHYIHIDLPNDRCLYTLHLKMSRSIHHFECLMRKENAIEERKNDMTKIAKRSPLNGTDMDMDDKCPRKWIQQFMLHRYHLEMEWFRMDDKNAVQVRHSISIIQLKMNLDDYSFERALVFGINHHKPHHWKF